MRFLTLLKRALALRCPLCGEGQLFRTWLVMHRHCPHCNIAFEREPGFFLGSIYINYGLTSVLVAAGYMLLRFRYDFPKTPLVVGAALFTVVFPIMIFPWARSLWLGFDQWRDPRDGELVIGAEESRKA